MGSQGLNFILVVPEISQKNQNKGLDLLPTPEESYELPASQHLHSSVEWRSSTMNYLGLQGLWLYLIQKYPFTSGQESKFSLVGTRQHHWETSRVQISFLICRRPKKYLPARLLIPGGRWQRLAPISTQAHDDTLVNFHLHTSISSPPPNLSPLSRRDIRNS